MKKIFLFIGAAALACTMQAKKLTLNVGAPLSPETVEYNEKGVWAETYNEEDYLTIDYTGMSFSHLPSGESWEGMFWDGFTISKSTAKNYTIMDDQFNCLAGGGLAGEGTPFLMGYAPEGWGPVSDCQVYFTLGTPCTAQEVYFCQSAWAYDNIKNGGGSARAFKAGDSLIIVVEGLNEDGEVIEGKQVTYFLADYRSENSDEWTVNTGWEKCDLTALGEVYGLVFTMTSSDRSSWGSNTALYFAIDGLTISYNAPATFENEQGGINITAKDTVWQGADEPVATVNTWSSGEYQFNTYVDETQWGTYYYAFTVTNETANTSTGWTESYRSTSGGAYEGNNFAVWYSDWNGNNSVTFEKRIVPGFFINNNAYTVNSMTNVESEKFDNDNYLLLTCTGKLENNTVGKVDFYLAKDGMYVTDWTYVDLSVLGEIDEVEFSMTGNKENGYGLATPTYFCMDNFGAACPADYVEPERTSFDTGTTALGEVEAAAKADKQLRNGVLYIIRDGKMYNAQGQIVK